MVYRNRGPKPRQLDPIKQMIAETVQQYLNLTAPGLARKLPDIDYIEAHDISPTETMLRIKTTNKGVRNFTIKIKENM